MSFVLPRVYAAESDADGRYNNDGIGKFADSWCQSVSGCGVQSQIASDLAGTDGLDWSTCLDWLMGPGHEAGRENIQDIRLDTKPDQHL